MNRHIAALTLGLFVLLGCNSTPQPVPIPPGAKPLTPMSAQQIETEADGLLTSLGITPEVKATVMARLADILDDPKFQHEMSSPGVTGVAAFKSGGGGFIVSGGGGEGLATFNGGGVLQSFKVTGISVGANVGGGSQTGLMLMVGLRHEVRFPDKYRITSTGGTAGLGGYLAASAKPHNGVHLLRIVGTGKGLSAQAGGGNITVDWVAR